MVRRTKIVATVGPATTDREMLEALVDAGMDIVRINCSHAEHAVVARVIQDLREISTERNKPVGILLDLSGPKIRTGMMAGGIPVQLYAGQKFILTNRKIEGNASIVSTNYAKLPFEVRVQDTILLDDGLIELLVLDTSETDVVCEVINGGVLKNKKGINLPGVRLSIPAVTEKDKVDLAFGLQQEVDFVALSFVRDPDDVHYLRQLIGDHWPPVSIIAKLEKPEALEHLDEILDAADGVMIARGDLGVELPPEAVPAAQKLITRKANAIGKPVITATQMLESMIENPRPTRAEASDVANAIFDGTDAIMLSGETAAGKYPVQSVKMMGRIAAAAEGSVDYGELKRRAPSSAHAIAHAACAMAVDMKAKAIAAFTKSGSTARLISQFRPPMPIIALTQHMHVYRQVALCWGVIPVMLTEVRDTEGTLALVEETLLAQGFVSPGDSMIITGGLPIAARGPANFVKLSVLPQRSTARYREFKGI
ncbi:MAG: pyruvate kinase [Candidatus Obscuribacterales bacterium]|nr:pyruvate kinase [Candidatus Obscuribacterales bacterium]